MSAFFFGSPERPLFGFYHPATGTGRGAVVICPPGIGEYQFAHRALRILAERLAERGHHVLRFDYSGTGDSWGACTDADPDAWIGDARDAVEELIAISGRTRVDLVGIRYGAIVAAAAAAGRRDVGRVVLWDPTLDGRALLEELGADPGSSLRDDPVELGAHLVSPRLAAKLRVVGPGSVDPRPAAAVLLLLTQPGEGDGGNPLEHVQGLEVERLAEPAPWVIDQSIWTGQVPAGAVRRIADWLA